MKVKDRQWKTFCCFAVAVLLVLGSAIAGNIKNIAAATCNGDLDCDGVVDGADLAMFGSDFGRSDCDPQGGVPKGAILMWSGEIDQDGHPIINGAADVNWVICDGRDIDGDGQEDVPDLRDRFIVAAGGNYGAHDVGGQKDTALAVGNLPAHQHGLNSYTDCVIHGHRYIRNSSANFWIGGVVPTPLSYPDDNYSDTTSLEYHGFKSTLPEDARCTYDPEDGPEPGHRHKLSGATSSAGSGSPTDNRPPFYAVYFIMKIVP